MKYDLIVIGGSAGVFDALVACLSVLPADFDLPIVVVRHQSPDNKVAVDEMLGAHFNVKTKMATSGEIPQPGTVYLAPPNRHLLFDTQGALALNDGPKVCYSRPSIDNLFESAAKLTDMNVIGVVMTGANADGAAGLKKIADAGGLALIQNPDSAEYDTMPLAAIKAVPGATLVWRDQIGVFLWDLLRRG